MIRCYQGLLGKGKTISMVNDAIPLLLKGRRIVTNTPFFVPNWKRPLSIKRRLQGWKHFPVDVYPEYVSTGELLRILRQERDFLALIDEASLVFSNYGKELLKGDYVMRFAQSRKFGIDIFYTSQSFKHTHKRLRDLTNEVVQCGYWKTFNILMNTTYKPEAFDIRTPSKFLKDFKISQKIIFPSRVKYLFTTYDSMYAIDESATITKDDSTVVTNKSKLVESFFT